MEVLNLTLKKKWFDMILSGEKLEEYREIKSYWFNRLVEKEEFGSFELFLELYKSVFLIDDSMKYFDVITFRNGYKPDAPTITVECLGIEIGEAKPEWSDNWKGDVFKIKLGKILNHQP